MSQQSFSLSDFKRQLCQETYGRQSDGKTCICCRQPPVQGINMETPAGWAEFPISGLCESCFNSVTEEGPE